MQNPAYKIIFFMGFFSGFWFPNVFKVRSGSQLAFLSGKLYCFYVTFIAFQDKFNLLTHCIQDVKERIVIYGFTED